MFCTKCGAPLDGGKFCTMCGTPVKAAAVEAPVVVNENCAMCGAPLDGREFCVMRGARKGTTPDSVCVPAPVVADEPIVEEMPVVEEAPAVEEAPVVEEAPTVEEIPAVEEVPVIEDNCAVCGAPMQGRAFCVNCGAKKGAAPAPVPETANVFETVDVCKNCGAPLNGKAFCVICGTPKDAPTPAPKPVVEDVCKNCGAPLNGKSFCVVCGTSKSGAVPAPKPVQTTYVPPVQTYAPVSQVSPLKKSFGSAKFLVTTIFVTIYVLLSIFAGMGDFGIPDLPYEIRNAMSTGAIAGNIIPILIAVGLWITYATAKGSGKMSSAGLSIISVIMLLYLIAAWIPVVLTALAGLVFFIPGLIMIVTGESSAFGGFITTDYAPGAALVLGICILIGAGVLLLFVLLFYRRLRLFAKSAVKSVKADKAEYKFASAVKGWLVFVGVMSIISAVVCVIAGLAIPAGGMFMYGISTLFAAIATLCGSSWIKSNCLEK